MPNLPHRPLQRPGLVTRLRHFVRRAGEGIATGEARFWGAPLPHTSLRGR